MVQHGSLSNRGKEKQREKHIQNRTSVKLNKGDIRQQMVPLFRIFSGTRVHTYHQGNSRGWFQADGACAIGVQIADSINDLFTCRKPIIIMSVKWISNVNKISICIITINEKITKYGTSKQRWNRYNGVLRRLVFTACTTQMRSISLQQFSTVVRPEVRLSYMRWKKTYHAYMRILLPA